MTDEKLTLPLSSAAAYTEMQGKVTAVASLHTKAAVLQRLMGRQRCTHCRSVQHEETCGHNRLQSLLLRCQTHVRPGLYGASRALHISARYIFSAWARVAMEAPCPLVVYRCPRPMCGHNHLGQALAHAHAVVLHAFLRERMQHETACGQVGMDVHGADCVSGHARADMAQPVPWRAEFREI